MEEPNPARRAVRTTRHRGRMTPARIAALEELGPIHGLDPDGPLSDASLTAAFGRTGPRLLDIGVGNGEASLDRARRDPDLDVVAVEVHRPGLAQLLQVIDGEDLTNVKVLHADVTVAFERISPGAFTEIRILFPDPWPKARHRRRRLADEPFLRLCAGILPPGGILHLATDWPDYADQMREAIAAVPEFEPVAAADGPASGWVSERPERPVTAYEQRGLRAGRPIVDLLAKRR